VTNNQMELRAAIESLKSVDGVREPVCLHTDSKYVIQGITQWIWGWRKNGWKTSQGEPVANSELWQELHAVVGARGKLGAVEWIHVRGHAGVAGNERADQIAVGFSQRRAPSLFDGPASEYPIRFEEKATKSPTPAPKTGKVTYLSLVGQKAVRHRDWISCERRVKGVSGARFKKSTGAEEEAEILKSWGMNPAELSEE
jgi:ribonuclease HI